MNGFVGEYEARLDTKGRFLLPSGFKKQIPDDKASFVLNRGFEQCLRLYTLEDFEPLLQQLRELDDSDPEVRRFQRNFLNGATRVELDTAGRLLIPQNLLEYAGLDKDIVLYCVIDKLEIWDKVRYRELFENFSPQDFSDSAKRMLGKKTPSE
jgi:MraZ protein